MKTQVRKEWKHSLGTNIQRGEKGEKVFVFVFVFVLSAVIKKTCVSNQLETQLNPTKNPPPHLQIPLCPCPPVPI